ncbi:MAG: hypothetical protein H8D63_00970 [Parcubacteria group bacterium]|nr:hypothetical protein [Parcubacteria group bacterium]
MTNLPALIPLFLVLAVSSLLLFLGGRKNGTKKKSDDAKTAKRKWGDSIARLYKKTGLPYFFGTRVTKFQKVGVNVAIFAFLFAGIYHVYPEIWETYLVEHLPWKMAAAVVASYVLVRKYDGDEGFNVYENRLFDILTWGLGVGVVAFVASALRSCVGL